jgi:hypothetical protein
MFEQTFHRLLHLIKKKQIETGKNPPTNVITDILRMHNIAFMHIIKSYIDVRFYM